MSEIGTMPPLEAHAHLPHHGQCQEGSCYQTLQMHTSMQQQQQSMSSAATEQQSQKQPRPDKTSSPAPATATTGTRRRISKACDRCNLLRSKCNGLAPCMHCVENNVDCTYVRQRRKRGKGSRRDTAREASQRDHKPCLSSTDACTGPGQGTFTYNAHPHGTLPLLDSSPDKPLPIRHRSPVIQSFGTPSEHVMMNPTHYLARGYPSMHLSIANPLQSPSPSSSSMLATLPYPVPVAWDGRFPAMAAPFAQERRNNNNNNNNSGGGSSFHLDSTCSECSLSSLPRRYHGACNVALSAPSLTSGYSVHPLPTDTKYPVLRPVLPYISAIIPPTLACELLEHYFSATSVSHPHPRSPYIVTFMFSKRAFFRQHHARICSPALLSSMLWVAARTSTAKLLNASSSARALVCQKLFDLTIKLLRPLLHHSPSKLDSNGGGSGSGSGGGGGDEYLLTNSPTEEPLGFEGPICSVNGTLDDVATYIHLGVVVSASEHKGPSLRWWNAAWGLARELRLGRELPRQACAMERPGSHNLADEQAIPCSPISEEEREERRRVWWLLFCMDRHLSLCYNKPICLPDRECESLLLPMDELLWQNVDHHVSLAHTPDASRPCGPPLEYAGPSLFGWFLPLMVILGEIIDLNHARSHPRCGADSTPSRLWDEQYQLINLRLENFEASMRSHEMPNLAAPHVSLSFETSLVAQSTSSPAGGDSKSRPPLTFDAEIQEKNKTVAYATHITHVLHILLTGRWDPLALLDDADMWIYSESFVDAMCHAILAAQSASHILEHDPDMSFMPFVFGIYLLQGSFLLLLMADKLQRNAAPDIVKACEIVVRAHEACTVTLSSEYQRNFRNAMRSALAQVKGQSSVDDCGEEHRRRRELLGLYRWTGDGTGLDTE